MALEIMGEKNRTNQRVPQQDAQRQRGCLRTANAQFQARLKR